jgi:hypothetical protein
VEIVDDWKNQYATGKLKEIYGGLEVGKLVDMLWHVAIQYMACKLIGIWTVVVDS